MSRITINLNENDKIIKKMIQDLKKSKNSSNPYINRSESEIAKMILHPALEKEHKKILKHI